MGLWNTTYLQLSAKFLYFEIEITTLVGISKKLLLFYWKCCISWEIYKFATFSINYLKLKLFNQLLQSQFIVSNILVSLDCLNLFEFMISCPLSMNLWKPNAVSLYKICIFELKPNFFFTVTKKMAIGWFHRYHTRQSEVSFLLEYMCQI